MASILCHTNVSEVVSKYPPKPVSNLQLTPGKLSISLTWEDPEDYTEEGYTCAWAKTVVVRKTEGYPNDVHDGTIVVTTVERNKYKSEPYVDSNLTAGTIYYYRLFPCSTDGVYGEYMEGSETPTRYKVMTVKIDLSNSNPETCGSYFDDAVDMNAGKNVTEWEDFFGYKPCLFKKGSVVGYLNPNNYAKFTDGSSANIKSLASASDVMIEFPRRGIKISKTDKIITVSMTDDPNDPDFTYYAHQRGSVDKDYFYLGVYLGVVGNTGTKTTLRSLSGQIVDSNRSLKDYEDYAKANGDGYGCMGYYQWLYIQVMYILQYAGNLNSWKVHGIGLFKGSKQQSGSGNTKGVMYGSSTYGNPVKLFGLEDIWGNLYQLISNYSVTSNYHIITTTDDRNGHDTSKYTDCGYYGGTAQRSGYPSDCIGTSEAGFTPTYSGCTGGSSSTYFCSRASIEYDCIPSVGGDYDSSGGGMFCFTCEQLYTYTSTTAGIYGARLQYL